MALDHMPARRWRPVLQIVAPESLSGLKCFTRRRGCLRQEPRIPLPARSTHAAHARRSPDPRATESPPLANILGCTHLALLHSDAIGVPRAAKLGLQRTAAYACASGVRGDH